MSWLLVFLIKIISPHLDILYPVLDVFITVFIVSAFQQPIE